MKLTKRNGNLTAYDDEKIITSILRANAEVAEEALSRNTASYIADDVFELLTENHEIISTQEIRSTVYSILCEKGYPLTAEHYMEYKR